jgi:hypothetical protein
MEKAKGKKTYRYWMDSWREGEKVRNAHLGSCGKMDEKRPPGERQGQSRRMRWGVQSKMLTTDNTLMADWAKYDT